MAFAATNRGAAPFAVFYLDLDRFKTINDTLGHAVGDELLKETAKRLDKATRETDLVARLGGDEFAILQMDISEAANAGALARNIQQELHRPLVVEGNELRVSCSIGICPWSPQHRDAASMLVQADLALYRAKEDGRNCYRFHSPELDREVLDAVMNSSHANILRAILQVANDLGVGVIIEGVETREQNALLQKLQTLIQAQAYYYSQVVDGSAAGQLLKAGRTTAGELIHGTGQPGDGKESYGQS